MFYRNLFENSSIENMKKYKEEIDLIQRQVTLSKMKKWGDFKFRRQKLLDTYISIKWKKYQIKLLITLIINRLLMRQIHLVWTEFKLKKQKEMLSTFIRYIMYFKYKVMIKKHGEGGIK